MTNTIGIRVYRISVHRRGNPALVPFDFNELKQDVQSFTAAFISEHTDAVQNDELERSWYFEQLSADGPGNSKGYVNYGTFGFESDFVDAKTKKKNYKRQTTDVEEIPLYYEIWLPNNSLFGMAAFQSFQGRSCIGLVLKDMKKKFESQNKNYTLGTKKLLPNDVRGSMYYSAPVKNLRLIKKNASGDLADRYFDNPTSDYINFEITMSARRNRNLGDLASLTKSLKGGKQSVVTHDGIDFDEAIAEIRVGKKLRKVGVFGYSGDAGVIDLTDSVKFGPNGHPTFQSMSQETDLILSDFYNTLLDDEL